MYVAIIKSVHLGVALAQLCLVTAYITNIIHVEHIEEYKMLENDFHTLDGMQCHKMNS